MVTCTLADLWKSDLYFRPTICEAEVALTPGGVLPYITYTGMCRPKGS